MHDLWRSCWVGLNLETPLSSKSNQKTRVRALSIEKILLEALSSNKSYSS